MTELELRTQKQNNALHMLYREMAKECLEKGITFQKIIESGIEIPVSEYAIKEIWRICQKAYMGEESTTRLNKKDVEAVYDIFNKLFAEKFGIHIPYPSIEELIITQQLQELSKNSL